MTPFRVYLCGEKLNYNMKLGGHCFLHLKSAVTPDI